MLKYKKFFFSSFLIKPSLGNLHDICCRIKLQKENSLAFSLNLISIHIQKLNCLFSKTVWPAVAPRWLIFDWNFKITERCTHVQLQKRHTHTEVWQGHLINCHSSRGQTFLLRPSCCLSSSHPSLHLLPLYIQGHPACRLLPPLAPAAHCTFTHLLIITPGNCVPAPLVLCYNQPPCPRADVNLTAPWHEERWTTGLMGVWAAK